MLAWRSARWLWERREFAVGDRVPGHVLLRLPAGNTGHADSDGCVGLAVCWLGRLGVLWRWHLPSHGGLGRHGDRHVRKASGAERGGRWLGLWERREFAVGDRVPGHVLLRLPAGNTGHADSDGCVGLAVCGWEGSGCSGAGICQVTVGSDATVTAMFEKLPVLSVAVAGSGSGSVESSPSGIACPGTCSYGYPPGTPGTLTPTAVSGSRFVGWEGSGCSGTGTCQVTLSSGTEVTAMFEKLLASPLERGLPIEPFTPPASFEPPTTTASVYLAGTPITTTRSKARVKLTCSGTGTAMCSGELTLVAKSTTKRGRGKRETIGTTTFSIQTGKTAIIELKLDAAGRALLNADHGRLKASLDRAEVFPRTVTELHGERATRSSEGSWQDEAMM